jgi:DNA-3-methyladenine glycosylase II
VAEPDVAGHGLSAEALKAGLDRLAIVDPDIARALERIGYPEPRVRQPGFATLLRIMVAQQLSTRSAAAIWARVEQACPPLVTAERFLALDEGAFRRIGFSRQKMAYGRALAEAIAGGTLDLEALATIPEEAAIEAISALRGFGRWSAEIYLLFALGRADVFPADDLALQIGMQRLKRLDARPNRKLMDQLAESWRPLRGCGALLLWRLYGTATLDDALIA